MLSYLAKGVMIADLSCYCNVNIFRIFSSLAHSQYLNSASPPSESHNNLSSIHIKIERISFSIAVT